MKCFDVDHVTEKGGYKNRYKNRNDNVEPNVYPFGRCGGNKRKCQSVNFSKLLDYTVDEILQVSDPDKNPRPPPQQVANTTTGNHFGAWLSRKGMMQRGAQIATSGTQTSDRAIIA